MLRAAVARNSETAICQSRATAKADETAPGLARRTAGNMGSPFDAAKEVTQTLAGTDPRTYRPGAADSLAEVAKALPGIRGPEAQRALEAVKRAMLKGQPMKDAEAELVGSWWPARALLLPIKQGRIPSAAMK